MTAPVADPDRPAVPRRSRRRWVLLLLLIPLGAAGLSWAFTADLDDHPVAPPAGAVAAATAADDLSRLAPDAIVPWPEKPLDGEPAKKILLEVTRRALARVNRSAGYTATFRREERVNGVLGPEIVSALKIRNQPFALYLKYQTVRPGKEVVYAEGHHDNKVIAHNGDWTRALIPRLAVDPNSPLALADSRHPVTDAGLINLLRKLLRFREMDIGDDDATTALDRTTLDDGRAMLRSIHTHSRPDDGRPFHRVEILYDPGTQVPHRISSYDWPASGDSGPLKLAERYTYDHLDLDAALTPLDFDIKNPAYAFMRY